MTISVPLNLNAALFPIGEVYKINGLATEEGNGYVSDDGLYLVNYSSFPYEGSLAYTGVDSRVDAAIAAVAGETPNTLVSAELTNIFLPSSASLTLSFQYVPGDLTKDDAAFVILVGSDGTETIHEIADSALVTQNNDTYYYTDTIPVPVSDTYRIVVAIGDASGTAYPSSLLVSSISLNLPASSSITGDSISLGGGYSISTSGGLLQDGALIDPNYASAGGAGNIASIADLISQAGGDIVAQGGGNIVAQGGGNLLGSDGAAIVAQGGGNIVAQGGGNIVAQGGGNIVAQGGSNIVAQGGGNVVSQQTDGLIFGLDSLTLPPGASATNPPTFTAGADTTLTAPNSYVLAYTPKVATLSNGKYVVVWSDDGGPNNGEIVGQVYNADGSTFGTKFVADPSSATAVAPISIGTLTVPNDPSTGPDGTSVSVGTVSSTDILSFIASSTAFEQEDSTYGTNPAGIITVNGDVGTVGGSVSDGNGRAFGALDVTLSNVGTVQVFPADDEDGYGSSLPPSSLSFSGTLGSLFGTFASDSNATLTFKVEDTDYSNNSGSFKVTGTEPASDAIAGQPTVAALANGAFVVGWIGSQSTSSGYLSSIYAQIVNADGTLNGSTIAISPPNGEDQFMPDFVPLASGGFVAVWGVNSNNVSNTSPAAQVFDATGERVGSAVQIPLPTGAGGYSYYQGSVATSLNNGGFAIAFVFLNQGNGPDTYATYVDLFDGNGAATSGPIKVSPAGEGTQVQPALATLTNGDIVVGWLDKTSTTNTQPLATLRLQIVDPTGALVGSPINVAQAGTDDPPSITALADGGFAVGWDAYTYSGGDFLNPSSKDVKVQLFNADGSTTGTSLFADAADSFAVSPSLATLPDQTVVAASVQGDFSVHTKDFAVTSPPSANSADNGVGVDGYISGATVFADAHGTGVFAAGDAETTTNAQGQFTLPASAAGTLVMTGGTDTSTGLAFTQTYTAPAGSTSITALSTLVQKLMAAGADLGTADAQVTTAFGLSGLTDLTSLDPIASVEANQGDGLYTLLADAVVADTLKLAQAAGASGDLFGKLATLIAANPFQAFDLTSVATMEGLGLSGQVATDTAALALASSNALVKSLNNDTGSLSKLTADVAAAETVAQGDTASALAKAATTSDTSTVVPTYTGSNLTAIVGATEQIQAGTPPDIAFTDVTTDTIGYGSDATYSGPVAGLQHQYIWSSQDSVAISTHVANTFLKGGAGNDALAVSSGSNVLDGGGGSNFLVGSTGTDGGTDTFFVDGRGSVVTWSTIVNFHAGDMATIFGFHAGLSTLSITGSDGAPDYTGLTIHSELAGTGTGIDASITFAGITQATSDAHFTYTTGTLGAGTSTATDYLLIQYNR